MPADNPGELAMKASRLLVAALFCAASLAALAQAPVASVPAVDLARYSGKWFEIASFPMFFQRNCVADTTAEYAPAPDGGISVHNRCRTDKGFDDAKGKASVVEGSGNSQLKVSFFWPFKADYWIVGLDPEYRWAVVGNPNRNYLWVLSRTAQLRPTLLQAALASASAQGFDLAQLRYTPQAPASAP
jgi:apolipoprotein D and lipocalin family protein